MIWYFWKGPCPLVRVKIEQRGRELNSFEELIKKPSTERLKPLSGPAFMLAKPINISSGVVGRQQPKPVPRASQWKTQELRNLSQDLKNQKRQLLNAPIALSPPRRLKKRRRRTIAKIEGIVVPDKASHGPLGSIPLTPTTVRRRRTALTAATPARSSIIIVIKKAIIRKNALSY